MWDATKQRAAKREESKQETAEQQRVEIHATVRRGLDGGKAVLGGRGLTSGTK